MKRLLEQVEAALTAAAFAEEGEVGTARQILAEARADEPRDGSRLWGRYRCCPGLHAR